MGCLNIQYLPEICLICRDSGNQDLISICNRCRNAYYHKSCIDEWFKTNRNNNKCLICNNILKIDYKYNEEIEIRNNFILYTIILFTYLLAVLFFLIFEIENIIIIGILLVFLIGHFILVHSLYNNIKIITKNGWRKLILTYNFKRLSNDLHHTSNNLSSV